jgi:uncharacterized protein (DUF362 family)
MSEKDEILTSTEVSISTGHSGYPCESPYSPGVDYPEYPFDSKTLSEEVNQAYDGVRGAMRLLKLDIENYGRKSWNPLGQIIHPGNTVVLKPNFVRDFRETRPGHDDCLITHGSIIRAALDFVYIALKGKGRIIIADAPQNDADFSEIRRMAGLDGIQQFYRQYAGFDVEVYDLRPEAAKKVDGVIVKHEQLPGDPLGYVKVDLNRHSEFCYISHLCHLLYGAEYDVGELRNHHHDDIHEYLVSKTILEADCVINLAKLKTHKKTGITVCMKNLVGINGNKNWLPHHREGTPAHGGDQFADNGIKHRIERKTMSCFRHVFPLFGPLRTVIAGPLKMIGRSVFGDTNTNTIRSGNWYGNDTTWRMVADLNRILMYADKDGLLCDNPARQIFCIVDGIVGGEGNGPLDPAPRHAGAIIAGKNPVAVDLVCSRLMGFNYQQIPLLRQVFFAESLPLAKFEYDDVLCSSTDASYDCPLVKFNGEDWNFKPHFGWLGHIEVNQRNVFSQNNIEM